MGEVVQFPADRIQPPAKPEPRVLGGGTFVSFLPKVCCDYLCSKNATKVLRLEYESGEKGAKFYCEEHYPVVFGG